MRQARIIALAASLYKALLSPLLHAITLMPSGCRFQPTCSAYAALALAQHGLIRGTAMAVWRLLRCHPLARGGWDPVLPAPQAGKSPPRAVKVP